MTADNEIIAELRRLMTPLGDVQDRSMFGGFGLFLDGTMFALVTRQGELYFRADDINRPDFETAGLKKFGKMPYFAPPASAMVGWSQLSTWATGAVEASLRAKKAKNRKTRAG